MSSGPDVKHEGPGVRSAFQFIPNVFNRLGFVPLGSSESQSQRCILCRKKSLDVNFLFMELLYKRRYYTRSRAVVLNISMAEISYNLRLNQRRADVQVQAYSILCDIM